MKKWMEQMKSYFQDLKSGEKRFSKDGMLILFFSGLLIYVILLPTKDNKSYEKVSAEEWNTQTKETVAETGQMTDYQTKLEQELADFLSQVEGVGEVEVLIYLNTTEEYVVEKDVPFYQTASQTADSNSKESNQEEATVYTVNGAGEQVPFVTQTRHPSIEGVVIAAEGAGQERLRVQIIRSVMALYGVEANKIDVLERKSKE